MTEFEWIMETSLSRLSITRNSTTKTKGIGLNYSQSNCYLLYSYIISSYITLQRYYLLSKSMMVKLAKGIINFV